MIQPILLPNKPMQTGGSSGHRCWTVQTDIDVERFEKLFVELMRRPPAN